MKTVISVVAAAAAVRLSTGNRHFIDVTASEQNGIQNKTFVQDVFLTEEEEILMGKDKSKNYA